MSFQFQTGMELALVLLTVTALGWLWLFLRKLWTVVLLEVLWKFLGGEDD